MRLLLDTHALIWWWDKIERIPEYVRAALSDRHNDVFVSAASAWEIATKARSGRLPLIVDKIEQYDEAVRLDGFRHLDVRHEHGFRGGSLTGRHGDPFDRLIAAQALLDDLTVVTRDPEIAAFGCKVLW